MDVALDAALLLAPRSLRLVEPSPLRSLLEVTHLGRVHSKLRLPGNSVSGRALGWDPTCASGLIAEAQIGESVAKANCRLGIQLRQGSG